MAKGSSLVIYFKIHGSGIALYVFARKIKPPTSEFGMVRSRRKTRQGKVDVKTA